MNSEKTEEYLSSERGNQQASPAALPKPTLLETGELWMRSSNSNILGKQEDYNAKIVNERMPMASCYLGISDSATNTKHKECGNVNSYFLLNKSK